MQQWLQYPPPKPILKLVKLPKPTNGSTRTCLACGHTASRPLFHVGIYRIEQCPRCLLGWAVGGDVDPESFYDSDYFVGHDTGKGYNDYLSLADAMSRTNRARVKRLKRLAPTARTLLDVGCGPGFFVKQAGEAGLDAQGLEVSDYAARYGREQLNLRVLRGRVDAEGLDRCGQRFDLITLWDVVEHLHQPDEVLRLLAQRLNPGGVLSLSTGDIGALVARLSGRRWHLYDLPEHLWFFSVPALRRLLRRAGLEPIKIRREVCWYTVQYLIDRLSFSAGTSRSGKRRGSILSRLSLPMTLFDIVTIHARPAATTA